MSKFHYVRLTEPQQYRMGYSGVPPNETPIYADCADCGAVEPVIYGAIAGDDGHFAVLERPGGLCTLAMFCQVCTTKRMQEMEVLEEQVGRKQGDPLFEWSGDHERK